MRNRHPLTLAEEETFAHVLSAFKGIRVAQAILLTKTYLAERGLFSPSSKQTFARVAHNWKTESKQGGCLMEVTPFGVDLARRNASKEAVAILHMFTEAGLTIGQARSVLRDVGFLIEDSLVAIPSSKEA